MDWLKCNICFNTYNDSNLRPRSLSCGHTFCETCLDNTIQNKTLTCPQCRKIFEINSAIELPINFVLEGLLKSLNPHTQDLSEGAISNSFERECVSNGRNETFGSLMSILDQQQDSLSAQKELMKTSAGMCIEHSGNDLIFRCSSHKGWVCEKCIDERGEHPKDNCTIISFKEEIENRKQEHNKFVDNERKACDNTIHLIEKHISYLSEKSEHHISLVDALQDLATLHKKEYTNLQSEITTFEKIIGNGNSVKQHLLDVKKTTLIAETLDEFNAARDILENRKSDARTWIKKSEREVVEGKEKLKTSAQLEMITRRSLEYREKCELSHEDLDKDIKQSEISKPLENKIYLADVEVNNENESRIFISTHDEVCKAHHKSIEHRCLKCQRWLCTDCCKFHTSVTGCSTITASTAVKNIKDEHTESVDKLLSMFENDFKCLFSKIKKHNDKIQEITVKKKNLSEEAETLAIEIKNINDLLEQGKELKENAVKAKHSLNSTNSPYAVMDEIEVLAEMMQALHSWSILNLDTYIPNNAHNIAKALEQGKFIYVECIIQNKKKHSKLSLHERDIYLHAFMEQTVDDGCIIKQFDCLQKLLPPNPSLMFLDLSLGNEMVGRVMVKLDENLPNIREYMAKYFTGQLGVSLAGVELKSGWYSNCIMEARNLPESEMKVTVDAIEHNTASRGDLVGDFSWDSLYQLRFQMSAHRFSGFKVFGSIISGMNILQECYNNNDREIKITDCGMVLKLK